VPGAASPTSERYLTRLAYQPDVGRRGRCGECEYIRDWR
jgi:hypothetical protein